MANYVFNPEKLCYEKTDTSRKQKLIHVALFTLLIILSAFLLFQFLQDVIQSPGMKKLISQRQELIYEIRLLNKDFIQYSEDLHRVQHNDDQLYRVFFEVDPVPETQRKVGIGGANRYQDLQTYPY